MNEDRKIINTYEELKTFIIILLIGLAFIIAGDKTYDELVSISFKLIGIIILYSAVDSKLFERVEHPNAYKVGIVFIITSTIVISLLIINFESLAKTIIDIIEYIVKFYGDEMF